MTPPRRSNPKRNATKPTAPKPTTFKKPPTPKPPPPKVTPPILPPPLQSPTPIIPPPPPHLNPELRQQTLLAALHKRPVRSTLFYSIDKATKLGLHSSIVELLSGSSWEKFLGITELTFADWTYEFLASFEFKGDPSKPYFKLGGVARELTVDEVNDIFGWEKGCIIDSYGFTTFLDDKITEDDTPCDLSHFWFRITGKKDWNPGHSKCGSIIKPSLRLLHRVIKSVFYPKKEMNQVTTSDLRHLLAFTIERHPDLPTIDYGSFLVSAFHTSRNRDFGDIHCGGFITCIAKHFGLSTEGKKPVSSKNYLLDVKALGRFGWLKETGDHYVWNVKRGGHRLADSPYAYLLCSRADLTTSGCLTFSPNF
ncbi:hypothetical protein SOVF_059520 [Spinacia oleracea]|nr:hypothetical protein SOVF_059520 [Spinacia oleracea]